MTSLVLASFVAGFLTVLVPCLLPLIPAIIGGSSGSDRSPYLTIASLMVAIIAVTVLIQFVSSLFYVPSETWRYIAGALVFFVGLVFVAPSVWTRFPFMARYAAGNNRLLGRLTQRSGRTADVAIGVALAPAFTSCSPTYLLIVATVLPSSFFTGLFYLTAYVLGLGASLLAIVILGQSALRRLDLLSRGWFKASVGVLLVITGIAVIAGFDKTFATFLLDIGFFDATRFELR